MLRLVIWTVLLSAAAFSQNLSEAESDQADQEILQQTLYRSYTAEEIYASVELQDRLEKLTGQMFDAAHRRIQRAERDLAEAQAKVQAGEAGPEIIPPILKEVRQRIEIGYLASARSNLLRDIVNSAMSERRAAEAATRKWARVQKYSGKGVFSPSEYKAVLMAFSRKFGRQMPVSADGDTRLHRALGFDHRGRVDVAVSPDSIEGRWLTHYLEIMKIPYYAFRTAVIGSATGAHIHIGPGSLRTRSVT